MKVTEPLPALKDYRWAVEKSLQRLSEQEFGLLLHKFPDSHRFISGFTANKEEFMRWVIAEVRYAEVSSQLEQLNDAPPEKARNAWENWMPWILGAFALVFPIVSIANVQNDFLVGLMGILTTSKWLALVAYGAVAGCTFWTTRNLLGVARALLDLERRLKKTTGQDYEHKVAETRIANGIVGAFRSYFFFLVVTLIVCFLHAIVHLPLPLPEILRDPQSDWVTTMVSVLYYFRSSIMLSVVVFFVISVVHNHYVASSPEASMKDRLFTCVTSVFFSGMLLFAIMPPEVYSDLSVVRETDYPVLTFSWFGGYAGYLVVFRLLILPAIACSAVVLSKGSANRRREA